MVSQLLLLLCEHRWIAKVAKEWREENHVSAAAAVGQTKLVLLQV